MKCFLLKMRVNGIKSIDKEIELNFYNSTINKTFDSFGSNVKAIYGANGAGKTGIIYAVEIYKNIMLDDTYLTLSNINGSLKNLINQKLNKFSISMTFVLLESERVLAIYEHSLAIGNQNGRFVIVAERLEKIIGSKINDQNKRMLIYSITNGELKLNDSFLMSNEIIMKSYNLLTNQTLINFIINNYKNPDLLTDHEFRNGICAMAFFESEITVVLQDTDRNYINLMSLQNQLDVIDSLSENLEEKTFDALWSRGRIVKNTIDQVYKRNFNTYKKFISNLSKFIKIFKPDLKKIEIKADENGNYYECQNIMVYSDGRRIDKKYESTGIKKLIEMYSALCDLEAEKIVFIDEFDANLHDVLLVKLVDYIKQYSKGQFIFTTHNLAPMDILQKAKHSIDFLSPDSRITSWKKNGNYTAASLYSKGLIEYSPFNLEAFNFLGVFGDDTE